MTTTTPMLNVREQAFMETAQKCGVQLDTAKAAWDNLASNRCAFLVMSGKMGSGKDTLAPLVLDALGYYDREHLYYANALKDESDAMFTAIRKGTTAEDMGKQFNMSEEDAHLLIETVASDLAADPTLHSRNRSAGIRTFLQILGTDVRRKSDPDYWVNLCMADIFEPLARGRSIFLTDARFPNEISRSQELGAFAVRLDVGESTQLGRLMARDGALPEASAFEHPSETALDDYTGYDLLIDNNGAVATAVAAITGRLADRRK